VRSDQPDQYNAVLVTDLRTQPALVAADVSCRTLLKIINLIFPSSFIQIAEGCNTNFEGFEQRPAPFGKPESNSLALLELF
jgi:hypothetical protein